VSWEKVKIYYNVELYAAGNSKGIRGECKSIPWNGATPDLPTPQRILDKQEADKKALQRQNFLDAVTQNAKDSLINEGVDVSDIWLENNTENIYNFKYTVITYDTTTILGVDEIKQKVDTFYLTVLSDREKARRAKLEAEKPYREALAKAEKARQDSIRQIREEQLKKEGEASRREVDGNAGARLSLLLGAKSNAWDVVSPLVGMELRVNTFGLLFKATTAASIDTRRFLYDTMYVRQTFYNPDIMMVDTQYLEIVNEDIEIGTTRLWHFNGQVNWYLPWSKWFGIKHNERLGNQWMFLDGRTNEPKWGFRANVGLGARFNLTGQEFNKLDMGLDFVIPLSLEMAYKNLSLGWSLSPSVYQMVFEEGRATQYLLAPTKIDNWVNQGNEITLRWTFGGR
jgi:hypothetical protein